MTEIELPYPPSVNHYYRRVGPRTLISRKGRQFRERVAARLAETRRITVRSVAGERFPRIIGYELGEKPLYREPGWDDVGEGAEPAPVAAESWFDEEEVPF